MTIAVDEMTLSDRDFRRIVEIADREAGIAIADTKKTLVKSRVAKRMRELGISSCEKYLDTLDGNSRETRNLVSALTTNVSSFFRERHHFDILRDRFLASRNPQRLRFWSAGCASGQEPYSLAISILSCLPDATQRDILILASDIDDKVLSKARSGRYTPREIGNVPSSDLSRFFSKHADGTFEVNDDVKRLVRFRTLNLNAPKWPISGPFDAILCRNVVIYFDESTQLKLWRHFRNVLKGGGILMLGHSERIQPLTDSGFEAAGLTTYMKTDNKTGRTECH